MLDLFFQKISLFFSFHQENVFELLLVLMALVWFSGSIFRRFKLPLMLGELLAGVVVGPAVLGLVQNTETIKILADLGVFFMLLHSGLESDLNYLKQTSKLTIFIAFFSLITPLMAGFFLGYWLGYPFETALFLGMVFSFTSVALVYSTIKSLKIHQHKVGKTLTSVTLLSELGAFLILSIFINIVTLGQVSFLHLVWVILKVLLFFVFTLGLGYKVLPKFSKIFNTEGMKGFTFTLVIALFFGLIAEKIGLHIILGAYLAGIFVRQNVREEILYQKIEDRVFGLSYSFLGPIFFASIGLSISFEILFDQNILVFLLICLTAVFAKTLPSFSLAYFSKKFTFREALVLGAGVSLRGEMFLILAHLGLNKIVQFQGTKLSGTLLDSTLFSSLILTVFFTAFFVPLFLKLIAGYKGIKL